MICRFTIFSCQKLESVGPSEIVIIESFLDSDNFDYVLQKNVKRDTKRYNHTFEGLHVKITNEVNAGF